jgi:lysophospholipase L1-like esterase
MYVFLIFVATNAFAQQQPDFHNEYYNKKRALQESIPKQDSAIIMFGNSLTEQGLWWEYFPGKMILNRGIGGDILYGMIDRLPDILENKPAKIFITAGVNDILFHHITEEQFEALYSTLIDLIIKKEPSCKIYLESLLPVNDVVNPGSTFLNDKNDTIKRFNNTIKNIVEKYNLQYIDVHSSMQKGELLDSDYTTDGIHLNGKGYLVWTSILKPYIYE